MSFYAGFDLYRNRHIVLYESTYFADRVSIRLQAYRRILQAQHRGENRAATIITPNERDKCLLQIVFLQKKKQENNL